MPPGYERRNFGSLAAVIGLATTGSLGQVRAYIKNDGARICVVLTVRRGVVGTCKQPQEQHCCEGPDSSVGFASCLPLHHASSSEISSTRSPPGQRRSLVRLPDRFKAAWERKEGKQSHCLQRLVPPPRRFASRIIQG